MGRALSPGFIPGLCTERIMAADAGEMSWRERGEGWRPREEGRNSQPQRTQRSIARAQGLPRGSAQSVDLQWIQGADLLWIQSADLLCTQSVDLLCTQSVALLCIQSADSLCTQSADLLCTQSADLLWTQSADYLWVRAGPTMDKVKFEWALEPPGVNVQVWSGASEVSSVSEGSGLLRALDLPITGTGPSLGGVQRSGCGPGAHRAWFALFLSCRPL